MKYAPLLFILFLLTPMTASAEEPPDFSRDKLLQLFADAPERPEIEPRIKYGIGTISFKALGTRWKIAYVPFFMPLPGSALTTNKQWPDPFLLTGTQYASTPRTWRKSREMSAELKGIERRLRKSAKVVVKAE